MGQAKVNAPKMISIKDLKNYHFEIPVYQRGFRWTRQQMKELIEDLYDFTDDNDRDTYCLQNVTVRKKIDEKNNTVFEVIDGQQRLTAIWILVVAFMSTPVYSFQSLPSYTLEYAAKPELTAFVADLFSAVKTNKSLPVNRKPKSIDSSFIDDALSYITGEFNYRGANYLLALLSIFGAKFQNGEKKICFLWNEIGQAEEDDEKETNYVIERFSNLNAGKIPLTESELIKAYFIDFLSKESKDKIAEFSLQWEEIEKGLNSKEFWSFISSGKYEETRIDYLFRIYLYSYRRVTGEVIGLSEQHASSRKICEILKENDACEIWNQVVQIYDTLKDWFNDYYFYHMIGLIIAIEENDASEIVEEIYAQFTKDNKTDFKEYLKKRVREEACYKIPFGDMQKDWAKSSSLDIVLEGTEEKEISYIKNKSLIKPILLLFNISLLVNAYSINSDNATERFPFLIYKCKETPIEIEHINPHHLEGKKANRAVYSPDEKKTWAEQTISIIVDSNRREELLRKINEADWGNPRNKALNNLIEDIEAAAEVNDLSNLTLVDKNLNIRYGDNFFKEKRRHILAAKFGNPINESNESIENKKENSNYYQQSVIFPGTMWVFMRQYTVSGAVGGSADNTSRRDSDAYEKDDSNCEDRWNKTDREEYIRCIQKSIHRLLTPATKTSKTSSEEEN